MTFTQHVFSLSGKSMVLSLLIKSDSSATDKELEIGFVAAEIWYDEYVELVPVLQICL